ncbi:MAG: hypothetical protein CMM93_09240 [Rickettsiales bacterium]|nr:hypothetical protein [Rickettsiales bacterium]
MGFEKTEPRNNQILLWGVVSVITLFALVPLFHSYFGIAFGAELTDKVEGRPNTEYEDLRDTQRGHLGDAPVNIEAAMQQLATRGRVGTPVMPRPNDGPEMSEEDYEASLAPLTGWSRLANERRTEAARRAMRRRRVPVEPEAASLEDVVREGADAPSVEVEDRPVVVPTNEPVEAPPARLPATPVRPSVMAAGSASAMAAAAPE